MDNDIFNLISRIEEKIQLWNDLAQAKGELLCKGKEDVICKLRAQFFNSKTQCLECAYETADNLFPAEEYLAHFFLGGEKYYFQSIERNHNNKIIVPLPSELYHLQRRQNYRVRIPDNYNAYYNIVILNDQPLNIIGRLGDLSSQGCRIVCQDRSPLLSLNDKVTGHVIVGKRSPIEINGIVRHIKTVNNIQTCGVEFSSLGPIVENKLFMMTMEIHKEVFRRP